MYLKVVRSFQSSKILENQVLRFPLFFKLCIWLVGAATKWEEVILGSHEQWTKLRLLVVVILELMVATTTGSGRAGQESVAGH